MSMINQQKSYTQEISKSVLYLSKNRGSSSADLEKMIKKFLVNMKHKKEDSVEHHTLVQLWRLFYIDVEKFRLEQLHTTAYSTITMDKLVNGIYMKNQQLIVAFNHFIHKKQKHYNSKMQWYKNIGYGLFAVVVLLLLYLFTQIHSIMIFIQKFSYTSKSIIQKASIEGLKPLSINKNDKLLHEATQNFNTLVAKIDTAINHSEVSIEHTTHALEEVENKIEDLLSLVAQMQEENKELSQKEDTVIDSLEILMRLTNQLKNVKNELVKLTSSNNYH
jgi:methyl-accepting chemotaxis protein